MTSLRRTHARVSQALAFGLICTALLPAGPGIAADLHGSASGSWPAGSRTAVISLETAPIVAAGESEPVVLRVEAPDGASVDCSGLSLHLLSPDGGSLPQEREWTTSGCYSGAAEIHVRAGARAVGRSVRLDVPLVSAGAASSMTVDGWIRVSGVTQPQRVRVQQAPVAQSASPTPAPTPPSAAASELPPALQGSPRFHVSQWSQSAVAHRKEADPTIRSLYAVLSTTPTAVWYDGVNSQLRHTEALLAEARAQGTVATLVVYGIPGRDCGLHSAGGQRTADDYRTWINQMSAAVGQQKVVLIVEPDAISFCGSSRNLTAEQKRAIRAERAALMTHVGRTFHEQNPNAALYIHAGSAQLDQKDAADAVIESGIQYMRGFAMNVAGLTSTERNEAWAEQFVGTLAERGVAGKHYVVDTARSGLDHPANPGATYNACNNPHAVPGPAPTTRTRAPHADAYLWIKGAGGSDGAGCHASLGVLAPPAGVFHPALAQAVVRNGIAAGTVRLP